MAEEKTKSTESTKSTKRLIRPEDNRIIAGVCSGLGNFFSVDPTVIRIIFILITVFGGSGILLYFVLWLIMPAEKSAYAGYAIRENAGEIKEETKNLVQKGKNYAQKENNRRFLGLVLAGLGILFLLENFGVFQMERLFKLWPVILIIIALAILFKNE